VKFALNAGDARPTATAPVIEQKYANLRKTFRPSTARRLMAPTTTEDEFTESP
jgi:hypothetical protein